jgi:hypothetical protein
MDGEERLALFEQFGVPSPVLMGVDVFLRFFGVHGMPIFGPLSHGPNGSALSGDRTPPPGAVLRSWHRPGRRSSGLHQQSLRRGLRSVHHVLVQLVNPRIASRRATSLSRASEKSSEI